MMKKILVLLMICCICTACGAKEDITEYFNREVLPFAKDAWIEEKKNVVGYEIPFTRYFYKYQAPKPSSQIMDEIKELEKNLMANLSEIMGE